MEKALRMLTGVFLAIAHITDMRERWAATNSYHRRVYDLATHIVFTLSHPLKET